jgi:pimeloyl-ACP methyl ester carboxylesterase
VSVTVRIDVRGLTFDVAVGGPESGREVLLLHGFPENARMWDGVVPRLHAAGLRTAAPDQRGYSPGARPADVAAYAMPELVADVTGLLDALGWAAVDLVGHDWGAAVAWHVAGRHPDRVRTLTTVSVPHPLALSAARREDEEQRQRSAYIGLFRTPGTAEEALLADGMRQLRDMLRPMPADQVELLVRPMAEPAALTAALNWYRAATRTDADDLGPAPMPTTYVWGTDDLAVARSAAERCAGHVSGPYRFVELSGASHWIPELQPDAVADAVLDWIGSQPVIS